MIGILRMRHHEARPNPDVVPYLKPLQAVIVALAWQFRNSCPASLRQVGPAS
jgi:hypothetical protein